MCVTRKMFHVHKNPYFFDTLTYEEKVKLQRINNDGSVGLCKRNAYFSYDGLLIETFTSQFHPIREIIKIFYRDFW